MAVMWGLTVGAMGSAHADPVASLIRTLQSAEDYKHRLMAAIGLAQHRDPRSVPALIAALHDPNAVVQGVAADILGEMGDHRARPALESLIHRSKSDFVRERAQNALKRIPQAPPPQATPPPEQRDPSGMTVRGLTGTLDQEAIQAGIKGRFEAVMGCINRRMADLPSLGGTIRLKLGVSAIGKTKWVRILSSDLGSLQVERCIVDVLETAVFQSPDGGETEFSIPLQFSGAVTPETVVATKGPISAALRAGCTSLLAAGHRGDPPLHAPPGLVVTLYLDASGAVVSVGLAADGKEVPAAFADALVENAKLLRLKYRPRSGGYAKLSFRLSCPGR